MSNITQFHKNLLTTFKNNHKNIINRISGDVYGDELVVTIRKEKEGRFHCINSTCLRIKPFTGKPHHMEIEEIVVGYDSEGYPWSDHMGGRIIDCSGLNVDCAIKLIETEMSERI
jgi:hypothetical protein